MATGEGLIIIHSYFVPMADCKNCSAELSGRFCVSCGQKANTQRISWHWLVHEVLGSVLVVDRGLLFTLKELFTRPGRAIREFLEGKRQAHFKPLGILVLTATVYSLLSRWIKPDLSPIMDAPAQVAMMEHLDRWMSNYYALMELALIPLFAFCSWVLLRKYGHNLVEHMVIQSYLAAQRITLSIVFLPFQLFGFQAAILVSTVLTTGYMAGYVVTLVQLYEGRPPVRVLLRALASLVLSFLFLVILAVAGVMVLVHFGLLPSALTPIKTG